MSEMKQQPEAEAKTKAAAIAAIREIDRQIDAARRQLRSMEKVKPLDARSWQAAWDKHPELRAHEEDLFRQRGKLQQVRDIADYAVTVAKIRRSPVKRPRKCPTCGQRTFRTA